jgi:hypothetical protein
MIVARHEVPGKRPPKEPSRRDGMIGRCESRRSSSSKGGVGTFRTDVRAAVRCDEPFPDYIDFFCCYIRNFVIPILQSPNRGAHICKNQTVPYGTALFEGAIPRHFVPGYDRTVPPGQNHSPRRRAPLKLVPMELKLLGYRMAYLHPSSTDLALSLDKKLEDPRHASRPRMFVMLTLRIFIGDEIFAYFIGIVFLAQIDHFASAGRGSLFD